MPMPGTQEIRKPLLEAFRGEAPHNFINSEILELIAEYFSINLNNLSSGDKNTLKSRINYAKADLRKNGLIYNPSGNTYMITNAGTKVLEDNPEIITDEYLKALKKKSLPVAETFGLEVPETETETVPTISEPELVTMPGTSPILEAEAESEITEVEPEPETLTEDAPIPETDTEPAITEIEPEVESLPEDAPILETETEPEISEIEPEPETLPEDVPIPETETEPEISEIEPEAETLPEDVPIPETEPEPEISEIEPEAETLPEDAPIPETEPEPEISEIEPEAETLPEDVPIPETDTEPEITEIEPKVETSPEDAPILEAETEPEIPEIEPGPETLPEDSPIPETDTEPEITEIEPEAETLPEDAPILEAEPELEISEIEPEAETLQEDVPIPETEPEPKLDDSDDIHLDDEPEDFADRELNDAPEENLDTEEDTDTMPEDLYSPEEAQEDFTHDETEQEEEYNPALLAAAMSTNSIDDAIAQHNSELADELLIKAAGLPSDRFEMLVIDLLSKMGYFAFQTARYTTESSGSDLIHGVILDNKTGANIYIQARKLSPGRTIGKADIQDFIDELADKGGKGIYATTASFSENAKILATDERIMLIDGEKLANLMIANNFCVNVEKVYEIKAIDSESFSEYED